MPLQNFYKTFFFSLDSFSYFDTFYMCAYATHVSDCQPEGDGISSRYNLLENAILRTAVWVVAVLACFGNVTVFMGRTIVKDDNAVHSFLIKVSTYLTVTINRFSSDVILCRRLGLKLKLTNELTINRCCRGKRVRLLRTNHR